MTGARRARSQRRPFLLKLQRETASEHSRRSSVRGVRGRAAAGPFGAAVHRMRCSLARRCGARLLAGLRAARRQLGASRTRHFNRRVVHTRAAGRAAPGRFPAVL
eukprot:CAMPEP_0170427026 /NCGR_PEP_ID=MMETSP0117_2-20130122/38993_1 /TAXON_ID=400756 /ORGANISM="Durinskia baltica, Strain CSIRO CS-38" /LENGTH=104 /DNA_ID=CAMNT_0010686177 /DNA_START=44 /DNA_END=356 /DNA_ORIENTATION=-